MLYIFGLISVIRQMPLHKKDNALLKMSKRVIKGIIRALDDCLQLELNQVEFNSKNLP